MYKTDQLTKLIDNKIAELSMPAKPVGLFKPIEYILKIGGKRIRPVLMLLTYNLYKIHIIIPSFIML